MFIYDFKDSLTIMVNKIFQYYNNLNYSEVHFINCDLKKVLKLKCR